MITILALSIAIAVGAYKNAGSESMKTIRDVSDEDRLVVLKWVLREIKRVGDDPEVMFWNTVNRLEKQLHLDQPTPQCKAEGA